MNDNSHKTAISRTSLSAPARYLSENNLLSGKVLDYGCGKGFDVVELDIDGYDPYYHPVQLEHRYDTIMCNYVLNVLPQHKWGDILYACREWLEEGGVAYISVRNDKKNLNGFTSRGTYQTFVELDLPIEKKTSSFVMYRMEK